MATSTCRAIGTTSWAGLPAAPAGEQHDVVAFKAGEVCAEELASGNDDDVEAGIGLVAAEQFAGETLGSIANDGAPELSRRGDTQPGRPAVRCRITRQHEHGHEATVPLRALRVDVLEVAPTPDAFVRLESLGHAES